MESTLRPISEAARQWMRDYVRSKDTIIDDVVRIDSRSVNAYKRALLSAGLLLNRDYEIKE